MDESSVTGAPDGDQDLAIFVAEDEYQAECNKCEKCGKYFKQKQHLKRHDEELHQGKYYECENCHLKFTRKEKLNRHGIKCVNEGLMKSDFATTIDEEFTVTESPDGDQDLAVIEVKDEHPGKCNKCDECGKIFARKDHLKEHKLNLHSPNPPEFKCDGCGRPFKRKQSLKRHDEEVHQGKYLECENCHLKFTRREKLNRHGIKCVQEDPLDTDLAATIEEEYSIPRTPAAPEENETKLSLNTHNPVKSEPKYQGANRETITTCDVDEDKL